MNDVIHGWMNTSDGLRNSSQDLAHSVVVDEVGAMIDITWVTSDWAVNMCALAVIISCGISGADMWHHVGVFDHPRLQSGTLRILLMIPVYGVLSLITLIAPESRFFLRTLRDTYEAFALYQFLALLVEYCGGEGILIQALERKRYKGIHPFPMCFLPMFNLDRAFFMRCKRWVLQYAVVKPLMALISLGAHALGIYDETNLDWGTNVFPWVFLVNNFALTWSLWYLVVFHQETERELHYCKPLLKFVCIKAIIFFSYWQTSALGIMLSIGMLYTGDTPEEREHAGGSVQEFLICLELVPIAILHHYGFGAVKLQQEMKEKPLYESAAAVRRGQSRFQRLDEALSLSQFFRDTIDAVFVKKNQLRHGGGTKDDAEADAEATRGAVATLAGAGSAGQASKQTHPLFSRIAWPATADVRYDDDDGGHEAASLRPTESSSIAATTLEDPAASSTDLPLASTVDDVPLAAASSASFAPRGVADGYGSRGDGDDDDAALHYNRSVGAGNHRAVEMPPMSLAADPLDGSRKVHCRAPVGVGADGKPSTSTAAALQICESIVATQHGERPTTAEVMHAAVAVELQLRRAVLLSTQRTAVGPTGVTASAQLAAAADPYDWSSDGSDAGHSDGSGGGDEEAEANERASRNAWAFGLRTDDFRIITGAAARVNRVAQRVLFDEDAATTTRFCVVCGRSDRELVQRKSGLKCRECLGRKHNYQEGSAI